MAPMKCLTLNRLQNVRLSDVKEAFKTKLRIIAQEDESIIALTPITNVIKLLCSFATRRRRFRASLVFYELKSLIVLTPPVKSVDDDVAGLRWAYRLFCVFTNPALVLIKRLVNTFLQTEREKNILFI